MVFANLSVFVIYRFDMIPVVPPRFGPGLFGYFHWLAVIALARGTQAAAIVLWLLLAFYFAIKVARMHRRPRAAFTVGHPSRYRGGFMVGGMGLGAVVGTFAGFPGYGTLAGAIVGLILARRARATTESIWGVPSARQNRMRSIAIGALTLAFLVLGFVGFFQQASPTTRWSTTAGMLGLYFMLLRGSHGPLLTWLGLSVLSWLGVGSALHLPLPLMAIGDGIIKLGFGVAMAEPLLQRLPNVASLPRLARIGTSS